MTGLFALEAVAVFLSVSLVPRASLTAIRGVPILPTAGLGDVGERYAVHRDDEAVKRLGEIGTDALGKGRAISLVVVERFL